MIINTRNTLTLAASVFLFIALINGLPYGYFTFLRFMVCGVAAYLWYLNYKKNNIPISTEEAKSFLKHKSPGVAVVISSIVRIIFGEWTFMFIAALFNPIIIISLTRAQWVPIDMIVGIFFVASLFLFKIDNKLENTKII